MTHAEVSAVVGEGATRVIAEGVEQGHETKVLFSAPGFSLAYAWFKSAYPLPRHSHDVDCLYYILGGSLRIGNEDLGVGDGFFVGGSVPYSYSPGPAGVEVLEFRAANAFDIKIMADNKAFWDKAVETVRRQQDTWRTQHRPSSTPSAT
jgi:hypothetical protein